MQDYSYLFDQYPEVVTLEQLHKICRMSKRKGKWLLENGVIPCKDSGKKTKRFQIKLADVVRFLEERDAGLLRDRIPSGAFSSGCQHSKLDVSLVDSAGFAEFLTAEWIDEPDMLTTRDTVRLTGYNATTMQRWIAEGRIIAILYSGRHLISKEHLVAHLAETVNQHIHLKPEVQREMVRKYDELTNAEMELSM